MELYQIETAEIDWMFDSSEQECGHIGQWVSGDRHKEFSVIMLFCIERYEVKMCQAMKERKWPV